LRNDEAALAAFGEELMLVVHQIDQDAIDSELLSALLRDGEEAAAAIRLQQRLDQLSAALTDLMLKVNRRCLTLRGGKRHVR
jgi:hypothetical protein